MPVMLTDFCEEATHLSQQAALDMFESLNLTDAASEIALNPFRNPLTCQGNDNYLPSHSNCFYFWLHPPEEQRLQQVDQV